MYVYFCIKAINRLTLDSALIFFLTCLTININRPSAHTTCVDSIVKKDYTVTLTNVKLMHTCC